MIARLAYAILMAVVTIIGSILIAWWIVAPVALFLFGAKFVPIALWLSFPLLLIAAIALARRGKL